MATTENNYTGDNSTVLYSFTFPYIDTTDIKVSLDSVVKTLTTHYTLANATQVQFNSAPGTGVKIRIYRDTDTDSKKATFFSGSAIRSQDLNENLDQTLYAVQEAKRDISDMWTGATTIDSTETFVDSDSYILTAAMVEDRIAAGAPTVSGIPTLRTDGGNEMTGHVVLDNAKEVRFNEADANGSAYVGIKGATDKGAEGSYTVSLPAAAPTANQILKADASTPTNLTWGSATAAAVTVADESSDTTCFPLFVTAATGDLATKSGSNLTFNSNTGQLGATILSGVLAAGTQSNAHTWSAINTYSKPVIGQQVTLTSSSNATALDLSLSNNFKLTLGENSTLSQPSNEVAGQSGSIIVIQDGSGSRTLAYHSHYKWPGGTVPTLSTAANAVDRIDYIVEAADKVHCVITYDIKV